MSQLLHKLNFFLMSVIKYIYLNSSSITINSHLLLLYMMNDPCIVQIYTVMMPTKFNILGCIFWYHYCCILYPIYMCVCNSYKRASKNICGRVLCYHNPASIWMIVAQVYSLCATIIWTMNAEQNF